ncbi:MAG: Ldh family oxidoreductase, partial [Nitrosarchaeum sp.]|nr:Ldh family oxidoreductase [Nitrosarchaeum sp.]
MKLNEVVDLSVKFLQKLELSEVESKYITENLIEAELAGRKTHGFIRLLSFKKTFDSQKLITKDLSLKIISETSNSLHVDGQYKLGYSPIYQSLEMAIPKAKQSKLFSV